LGYLDADKKRYWTSTVAAFAKTLPNRDFLTSSSILVNNEMRASADQTKIPQKEGFGTWE